jgi:hypothetical protein
MRTTERANPSPDVSRTIQARPTGSEAASSPRFSDAVEPGLWRDL